MKTSTLIFICILCAAFNKSYSQASWKKKSSLSETVRWDAVGFSVGNYGYIATGVTANGALQDLWQYDPTQNSWTQKADFGGGKRRAAIAFSIGDKGYVGTGLDDNNSLKKDFWEFDPALNIWTQKGDFAGDARDDAFAFTIGNKGYIGLGTYPLTDFWQYNPETDTWIQKASLHNPKSGTVGFSIGDKGYIACGEGFQGLLQYDTALNVWKIKQYVGPWERFDAVGFSVNGKGYVGTGHGHWGYRNDFWEYDPATDTWAETASMNSERGNGVSFVIHNHAFVGTGIGPHRSDLWEFIPDGQAPYNSSAKDDARNEMQNASLNIYPNPAADFIQLDLPSSQATTLSIFNLQGEVVKEEKVTGSDATIDVSDLAEGIYLVKTEKQVLGKFVKE